MAVYDLEEQEQLDELKTWWKQYGDLVTGILAVVAIAVAGWQGWNWYQRNQAAQASVLYSALQKAAAQRDSKRVKDLSGQLIEQYSGSAYAGMGAMLSARAQLEAGDGKTARAQLTWASEHAFDEGMRDLARLRMAILIADEKSHDEALAALARNPVPALQARFDEVRGDIHVAQGKLAEAKTAYEAALAAAADDKSAPAGGARGPYREVLRGKADALAAGGAK